MYRKGADLNDPTGAPAGGCDRMMLQNAWGLEYRNNRKRKVKFFNMGHPTAPIDYGMCVAAKQLWEAEGQEAATIQRVLCAMDDVSKKDIGSKAMEAGLHERIRGLTTRITQANARIGRNPHEQAAQGFRQFYSVPLVFGETPSIQAKNILFSIGASEILYLLLGKRSAGSVLLRRVHYPLHKQGQNTYVEYDVLRDKSNEKEVTFAEAVQAIDRKLDKPINVILICNPGNPTGEILSESDWDHIFEQIRPWILEGKEFWLVEDGAYAEMAYNGTLYLIEILYKKLADIERLYSGTVLQIEQDFYRKILDRVLVIRSATKGFSGAGARMGVAIGFNERRMAELKREGEKIGDLPFPLQVAYADALCHLNARLMDEKIIFLSQFYEGQVRYVENRLIKMGMEVRDAFGNIQRVQGGFYVRANFSRFLDFKVTDPRIQQRLREIGLKGDILDTDEAIAYYLLVTLGYVITPYQYFGGDPKSGILRITCGEGINYLKELLDEIERLNGMLMVDTHLPSSPLPSLRDTLSPTLSTHSDGQESPLPVYLQERKATMVLPREKYALLMQIYWERIAIRSQRAHVLISAHGRSTLDRFKAIVKPDYECAIQNFLADLLDFQYQIFLQPMTPDGAIILRTKSADLLQVVRSIMVYLRNAHVTIFYGVSVAFPRWEEQLVINGIADNFSVELRGLLSNVVEQSVVNRDSVLIGRQLDFIKIISLLSFEVIFYNYRHMSSDDYEFSDIMSVASFEHRYEIEDSDTLTNSLVKTRAFVDYAHPRGHFEYSKVVADALSIWYDRAPNILPDQVLFFGVHTQALLDKVFEGRVIIWGEGSISRKIKKMQESIKPTAILFCNAAEYFGAAFSDAVFHEIVNDLRKVLKRNPNIYLVSDESLIERCLGQFPERGRNCLAKLLWEDPNFRNRLVIIRSSISIFTSQDKISVAVMFNANLMAKFVECSIVMHGHAPLPDQYAYAFALQEFIDQMQNNATYRRECEQYIRRLCKYYLSQSSIGESETDDSATGRGFGIKISATDEPQTSSSWKRRFRFFSDTMRGHLDMRVEVTSPVLGSVSTKSFHGNDMRQKSDIASPNEASCHTPLLFSAFTNSGSDTDSISSCPVSPVHRTQSESSVMMVTGTRGLARNGPEPKLADPLVPAFSQLGRQSRVKAVVSALEIKMTSSFQKFFS